MGTARARSPLRKLRRVLVCATLGLLTTGAVGWTLFLNFSAPTSSASFYRCPTPWWFLRAQSAGGGVVRYFWVDPTKADADAKALADAGVEQSTIVRWTRLAYDHSSFWAYFSPRSNPTSRFTPAAATLPPAIDRIAGRAFAAALDQCGWPLPALQSRVVLEIDAHRPPGHRCDWGFELPPGPAASAPAVSSTGVVGGPPPPGMITDIRSLPLMPVWPGFVVDSLLYAAVWGFLLWTPRAIARALQRKPGTCKRCGYDLAGLSAGGCCPECGTAA